MMHEEFLITHFCAYCKRTTKQLVKEISEHSFKKFTKSDFITWCEVCAYGSFMTKAEYKLIEPRMAVTIKAGGILWKAIQQLNV